MKLLTRYSRINLIATVIVFIISAVAFYFTLHYVLTEQIDEDLEIEEKEILSYVQEHERLPESISVQDQLISYRATNAIQKRFFQTTQFTEPGEATPEKFRQLIFNVDAGGKWYQATVSKSLEEAEGITRSVLSIAISAILIILLLTVLINRIVLRRLWRPFYRSLDAVRDFKVGEKGALNLRRSGIDEFMFMDETLEQITNRARIDYLSLKTFSENASHEIQTPLAVIRAKLDLISQDEGLSKMQSEALQAAYNALQKLTRLNHSLLLLARIENRQFSIVSEIDVNKKVQEKLIDLQEIINAKPIHLNVDLKKCSVSVNEDLLDVLLNNMIGNAIRHNVEDGTIDIRLSRKALIVCNTSTLGALELEALYRRFGGSASAEDSTGLGLSIVKQICDSSGFQIEYAYHDRHHCFTVSWMKD